MALSAKIQIVGCGPGAAEYLTAAARQEIENAEVLAGARRLLDLFPAHASSGPRGSGHPSGERAVPALRIAVGADIRKALDEIAAQRELGRRVVVLVTGDPGICSLAQPVVRRFGQEACNIIPGVSSLQVAFARVGLDWLNARFLSAHAGDPDAAPNEFQNVEKLAILAGREGALAWIAKFAAALGSERRAVVCENLTLPDERIREVNISELAALKTGSSTLVLLLKKDASS